MTETIVDIEAYLTKRQYREFLEAVSKQACLKYLAQGSYDDQRGALDANLQAWLRASGPRQPPEDASEVTGQPPGKPPQGEGKPADPLLSSTGAVSLSRFEKPRGTPPQGTGTPPQGTGKPAATSGVSYGPRSLKNFASNCYANACFQMLYDMEGLRDFLINLTVDDNTTFKAEKPREETVDADTSTTTYTEGSYGECSEHIQDRKFVIRTVCQILRDIKRRIDNTETQYTTAYSYESMFRDFVNAMRTIRISPERHEDAHEFLQAILTSLACLPHYDYTTVWLIKEITFPQENRATLTRTRYDVLTVSAPYISNDQLPSIQACIDLDGQSRQDDKGQEHSHTYEITGRYCVVLYYRFAKHQYTENSKSKSKTYKLSQPVQDYQEDVIIGKKRLKLRGVVTQLGGMDSGHYVYSHKTNETDEGWISYNDDHLPVEGLEGLEATHKPKYGYIFVYDVTVNSPEGAPRREPISVFPEGATTVEDYAERIYSKQAAEKLAKRRKKAAPKAKSKRKRTA